VQAPVAVSHELLQHSESCVQVAPALPQLPPPELLLLPPPLLLLLPAPHVPVAVSHAPLQQSEA
jgi:hypothetical protein